MIKFGEIFAKPIHQFFEFFRNLDGEVRWNFAILDSNACFQFKDSSEEYDDIANTGAQVDEHIIGWQIKLVDDFSITSNEASPYVCEENGLYLFKSSGFGTDLDKTAATIWRNNLRNANSLIWLLFSCK